MNRNLRFFRKLLLLLIFLAMATSCRSVPQDMPSEPGGSEEYIWVSTMTEDSMFLDNDIRALEQFAAEKKVKVSVMGPKQYDIPGQLKALNEAIDKEPAGILVLGMEDGLGSVVNQGIERGIPIITVDADLPKSNRIAFVGSDWYDIGVKQATRMVKLLEGKGKVAIMGIVGADNMSNAFTGFKDTIEKYPGIVLIGEYDDMASRSEAQRLTETIINAHPDIAGIAGFDNNSAMGIAAGISACGLTGMIRVTAMDIVPDNIALLRRGGVDYLVGQKRKLFTYYGAQLLYDLHHSTIRVTDHDDALAVSNIPEIIYTGVIEVDRDNVDLLFN